MDNDLSEPFAGNHVDAIAFLARAGVQPQILAREDGTKYALFPDKSVVELTRDPVRKRGAVIAGDRSSFIDYVDKHKTDGTLVTVEWTPDNAIRMTATLDHHSVADAGWCGHICRGDLATSAAWRAWIGSSGREFSQRAFAEFLEEHGPNVVVAPNAAEMLELASTLEATVNANFRSAVRLHNGDRELMFKRTTEARAGEDGTLVIPRRIELALRPFDPGGAPIEAYARFKYRVESSGLTLFYEIEQLGEIRDRVVDSVRVDLAAALGVLVIVGTATR